MKQTKTTATTPQDDAKTDAAQVQPDTAAAAGQAKTPEQDDAFVEVGATRFSDGQIQTKESYDAAVASFTERMTGFVQAPTAPGPTPHDADVLVGDKRADGSEQTPHSLALSQIDRAQQESSPRLALSAGALGHAAAVVIPVGALASLGEAGRPAYVQPDPDTEEKVDVMVPADYTLVLDNGKEVPYAKGPTSMPLSHFRHWWSFARGVREVE